MFCDVVIRVSCNCHDWCTVWRIEPVTDAFGYDHELAGTSCDVVVLAIGVKCPGGCARNNHDELVTLAMAPPL